jgi:hypothetical protein
MKYSQRRIVLADRTTRYRDIDGWQRRSARPLSHVQRRVVSALPFHFGNPLRKC